MHHTELTMQSETKQSETIDTVICDRCGRDCHPGEYEIRYFGPRDRQTGYQDEELVCRACLDDAAEQAEMDREDEERYAEGDRQFTAAYEEGEI